MQIVKEIAGVAPIFLLLISSLHSPAEAQPSPIQFKLVEAQNELSHRSIYAITQDHDGFLWIGTVDGLNRYDGYNYKVYKHNPADSSTLSNNLIRVLLVDSQNNLWVGTENGLKIT